MSAFLFIHNELAKNNIKKSILFIIAWKKYLGINLTKESLVKAEKWDSPGGSAV